MPVVTYTYTFNPFLYLASEDVATLSQQLSDQQVSALFTLRARRRRGAWGTTLPPGVFDNDLRPAACDAATHAAARDRVYAAARAAQPYNRRPFRAALDVATHDGELFYHPEAIYAYAQFVEQPFFLRALYRFLEAADKDHALVVPPRERVEYVPPEQRVERFGHACRGPSWTEQEDLVLRRWFGKRTVGPHAGHHVKLTEEEWARVLEELPRRNRDGVRNRIVELNKRLQALFFRNGFVSLDRLPEYMSHVLGERPRAPIRPTRRRARAL